jgi:hypothetical protein
LVVGRRLQVSSVMKGKSCMIRSSCREHALSFQFFHPRSFFMQG